MSSSKKKQLRKEQYMTERQVAAAKEAKKMKTYTLTDNQLSRADINGDGRVNTQDYVLLKRYIMKTWAPKG